MGMLSWGLACQVQGHEMGERRPGHRREDKRGEDLVHWPALGVLRSPRGQSNGDGPNVILRRWRTSGGPSRLGLKSGHREGNWGANGLVPRNPELRAAAIRAKSGEAPRLFRPRRQDLHPQEAPGALRRGGVAGSAGQTVPRPAGAERAEVASEPQRGAAGTPSGVHARQCRPAPPRRATPAQGSLAAGLPRRHRGRTQVPGAGGHWLQTPLGRCVGSRWRPGQRARGRGWTPGGWRGRGC